MPQGHPLFFDMKQQPLNYAVVDTETTGLRAGRDRITEIGVVFIRNGAITGVWQKLINPGIRIPEKIQLLTGISDHLVQDEQPFEEVADEFESVTSGFVLVGHHVAFDYSFLKSEMNLAGWTYSRRTICTSELARYLIPGLRSYSLRHLCGYFGITNERPHRALSDATATASLFIKLMGSVGAPDLRKLLSGKTALQFLPGHIRNTILNELPEKPGIYYFLDRAGKPLYIGKATNIRSRVISHFRGDGNSLKILAMAAIIHRIKTAESGSAIMASLMEDHEIRHYWPPWNEAQKKPNIKYGVVLYTDMAGRLRIAITKGVKLSNPVRLFHQYHHAADFIRNLVKSYSLHGAWCGVPDLTGGSPDLHEKNFRRMTDELTTVRFAEVYLLEGRKPGEKGFLWIENGTYRGTGFFQDSGEPEATTLEHLLTRRYSSVTTEAIIARIREQRPPDLVFYLEEEWRHQKQTF
jgi:DNA polymerase-3 subunit epsilon